MIASGVSEGLNPSKINILRTDYSNRLYHVLIDSPTEDIGRLHRVSLSNTCPANVAFLFRFLPILDETDNLSVLCPF